MGVAAQCGENARLLNACTRLALKEASIKNSLALFGVSPLEKEVDKGNSPSAKEITAEAGASGSEESQGESGVAESEVEAEACQRVEPAMAEAAAAL